MSKSVIESTAGSTPSSTTGSNPSSNPSSTPGSTSIPHPFRFSSSKLSIYDSPELQCPTKPTTTPHDSSPYRTFSTIRTLATFQDKPNDLELLIRDARLETTKAFASTRVQAQGIVNHWLALEKSAQDVVGTYHEPTEDYIPGLIYVTIAGFAGSILAKNSNILVGLLAPVAGSMGAFAYYFPTTLQNIAMQRHASTATPFKIGNLSVSEYTCSVLDKAASTLGITLPWTTSEKK
ncbi:hypothetical protein BATDEDRAFT_34297 [Batrachochytrium dendrobatidis JAM81]|uniref:MICOS complex subunit n=2 Tax=Batrachochytrium dendrobatidis TaxID=109871 RepID=F4NUK5_BATDJ|nr:uncharacterized protein BATDEDRAFT_34297 [Batrachochytrium dendrobatidis JAM81]EGF83623.1 hypothetical protein BATDEDRAFT_34297 [Batrachochytrium dendrobatidis JAM81]KAJ8327375.1 hypothetical protein O5D80_004764 [Batrachochytrium dendrobatidis]KAK5665237.1 hypothetical protein QVD99_008083 [Batrachochytrium dendrobatidis]|eukprot:XP_006675815.1 hypothetical protein BATDEDRAFT_34297 [Batrachochytrium dendrobatidis JAM81]